MLLVALLAAQAAVSPDTVTVPTFWKHFHEWNGRQVVVRGWLHGCGAPMSNLQGRCYLTPSRAWRQGHHRLRLDGLPRPMGGAGDVGVGPVLVRGIAEEDRCPVDTICLDGESDLRVGSVQSIGGRPL